MANPNTTAIRELVKNNPHKFTYTDLSNKFNMTSEQVRGIARSNKDIKDLIKIEKQVASPESVNSPNPVETSLLKAICEERNLPFEYWGIWWDKTKDHSIAFYNKERVEQLRNTTVEFLQAITKSAPAPKIKRVKTGKLIIPSNYDVHIGKHCELIRSGNTYTPAMAVERVLRGQAELYEMTKVFDVTDVILPLGNDIVHVDSNKYTTTNGTPQDNYGSVEGQILLASELYIRSIEEFTKEHNVWLVHVPSNHDRVAGWTVSQIVGAYFKNNPRVKWTSDTLSNFPRKYFVFGDNLIMFEHGETKEEQVVGQVMVDARQALAQTRFTYVYRGHTHHKQVGYRGANHEKYIEKDYNGATVIKSGNGHQNRVKVEVVRSPSPADAWHAMSGYDNLPAVEMFVHCPNEGQIARFTKFF